MVWKIYLQKKKILKKFVLSLAFVSMCVCARELSSTKKSCYIFHSNISLFCCLWSKLWITLPVYIKQIPRCASFRYSNLSGLYAGDVTPSGISASQYNSKMLKMILLKTLQKDRSSSSQLCRSTKKSSLWFKISLLLSCLLRIKSRDAVVSRRNKAR